MQAEYHRYNIISSDMILSFQPYLCSGIYPRGGGCHSCSSPYHLMKDCPIKASKGEKITLKLQADNKVAVARKDLSGDEDNDSYWL